MSSRDVVQDQWLKLLDMSADIPSQNAADGGGRDAELAGDLLARVALSAQSLDCIAGGLGSLAVR